MTFYKSPLRLFAFVALFFLYAQAQVTGEGGSASGVIETSVPVTKTASLETGSPTNYYSSVHPQITLPRYVPALSGLCAWIADLDAWRCSSAEPIIPVSGGSSTNSSLNTGVIVAITIALVISISLLCVSSPNVFLSNSNLV